MGPVESSRETRRFQRSRAPRSSWKRPRRSWAASAGWPHKARGPRSQREPEPANDSALSLRGYPAEPASAGPESTGGGAPASHGGRAASEHLLGFGQLTGAIALGWPITSAWKPRPIEMASQVTDGPGFVPSCMMSDASLISSRTPSIAELPQSPKVPAMLLIAVRRSVVLMTPEMTPLAPWVGVV